MKLNSSGIIVITHKVHQNIPGVMMPSVLLVEDEKLLCVSLRIALESMNCCQICGEAATGADAVKEVIRLRPDVVLMDVGLPTIDGIEAT